MLGSKGRGLIGAFAVVVALTGTAFADPTPAERETARTLLLSGREKRKTGNNKEALSDFEKAHAIMHVPTTGLDLGKTQEALGMLVEARATYLESSRYPKQANESPAFQHARDEAKKLADAITPRLATLTVSVPKDAKVKIDDGEISASSIGVPLKVNPGKHVILATLGSDEKRSQLELSEGETKSVALELAGAPVEQPKPKPPEQTTEPETKMSPLVWAGGAVAAVGVVVGAITGIYAISTKSDVAGQCTDGTKCPPKTWDELDRGVLMGNISTGAFIVAGLGGALMIYGFLNPSKVEPGNTAIRPRILPTPFGVAGTF
jgi:hypothetical protein